ncbi:MAG TPA: glycogen synthase [Gemmatimonadota bacterium]|nr:glycogen synthase [Gemmatimonadota bacterium]
MRILQLASEAVPFAKTGGLGDVVGAITRHLASVGHEVDLILPYYRAIARAERADDRPPSVRFAPSALGTSGEGRLVSGPPLDGARTWFVDVPELFDRDGLYGAGDGDHPDNLQRFAAFVRAALLAAERLELAPDIVHCHDWQTALAPAWLTGADAAPTVFTIHNLAYQGWFPATDRGSADVAPGAGPRLPGAGDLHLLRVGLTSADQVTTVSPTYASEILQPEFGFGLDELLRDLRPPVVGILNGIDTEVWNPADDPYLPDGWQVGDMAGKRSARVTLADAFGIDAPSGTPVFGLVSRLVEQKGLGLLEELQPRIAAWREARFVLLGTGEVRYERLLEELSELPHVGARVAFDERLAHLVEGGSDFFLMPSKFEPCGLNQMISQRYGTLPIVHRTGGLADTVTSVDAKTIADGSATGIVFEHFDAAGLEWAIREAMRLYADPASYALVQAAAMRLDHSWNARIAAHERLYERVRATPAGVHRDTTL